MFEAVIQSPLFGIVLSVMAFEAGIWIQKKTRKRLNNGVLPSKGAHHNAIGSNLVWLQQS